MQTSVVLNCSSMTAPSPTNPPRRKYPLISGGNAASVRAGSMAPGSRRRMSTYRSGRERAELGCRLAPDQPVSADHGVQPAAAAVVEHQQMIADRVEGVAVAAYLFHARKRSRAELFIEDPIAQRLGRVDIGGALREPHL